MGVRSSRGDKGFTDLSFHKRVSKDSTSINAIGDLDELNSIIGLVRSRTRSRKEKAILERVQHAIGKISSELTVGSDKKKKLGNLFKEEDAEWINKLVFHLEAKVKIEKCFYTPGDNEEGAFLDFARSVARRAERSVVRLFRRDKIKNDSILIFLNCVSDVLFIMAREKSSGKKRTRKHKSSKGKK